MLLNISTNICVKKLNYYYICLYMCKIFIIKDRYQIKKKKSRTANILHLQVYNILAVRLCLPIVFKFHQFCHIFSSICSLWAPHLPPSPLPFLREDIVHNLPRDIYAGAGGDPRHMRVGIHLADQGGAVRFPQQVNPGKLRAENPAAAYR